MHDAIARDDASHALAQLGATGEIERPPLKIAHATACHAHRTLASPLLEPACVRLPPLLFPYLALLDKEGWRGRAYLVLARSAGEVLVAAPRHV